MATKLKAKPVNALLHVGSAVGIDASKAQAPAPAAHNEASATRPDRIGKTNITGYFPVAWKNSLRLLQIQSGQTMQESLEEALRDLFRKHNLPVPEAVISKSRQR